MKTMRLKDATAYFGDQAYPIECLPEVLDKEEVRRVLRQNFERLPGFEIRELVLEKVPGFRSAEVYVFTAFNNAVNVVYREEN